MVASQIFLVLTLVPCILSESLMTQECETATDYVECGRGVMERFFRNYSAGVPEHNLKSTDPITIPNFNVIEDLIGITSEFKNIKVTGFKDVTIPFMSLEKRSKTHMKIKFELVSEGDLVVNLKSGKTFSGTFKYGGDIEGDTQFSYVETKKNDLLFFEVGPEKTTCKVNNIKTAVNPELSEAISKDPECKAMIKDFERIATIHYEKILCKMAAVVFETSIENTRKHVAAGI